MKRKRWMIAVLLGGLLVAGGCGKGSGSGSSADFERQRKAIVKPQADQAEASGAGETTSPGGKGGSCSPL